MSAQQELQAANGGELAEQKDATPLQMVQTAMERGMDAATIKEFMDLADRHEAKQAKRAFDQAMSTFRSQCPTIEKTAQGHNSKYAKLDKTIEQIKGLMHECGLSHSWRTGQTDGQITVTCVVSHIDGHSEQTSLSSAPDDGGKMNSIQRIGSAVSYLERYTLFAILGLASGDMDDDGRTAGRNAKTITKADADHLDKLASKVKGGKQRLENYLKQKFGSADPANIPADQYKHVLAIVEANIGGERK